MGFWDLFKKKESPLAERDRLIAVVSAEDARLREEALRVGAELVRAHASAPTSGLVAGLMLTADQNIVPVEIPAGLFRRSEPMSINEVYTWMFRRLMEDPEQNRALSVISERPYVDGDRTVLALKVHVFHNGIESWVTQTLHRYEVAPSGEVVVHPAD